MDFWVSTSSLMYWCSHWWPFVVGLWGLGLRQPPSLTPSIDLIPSPLCLPDHPCAAIALALWQAAISYAGKGVSESTEVYRAWKAAEGYPKYLEHVCGKDGSVKLVKKNKRVRRDSN